MKRPAEKAGAATGAAGVIVGLLAHNYLAAGLAALAWLPGAVTLVVARGGVKGAVMLLWRGRR